MALTVALAGDTMLGRLVGERLRHDPPEKLFDPALAEMLREADLFVCNLECAISERGEPWPDPSKPFFFRAPPSAVDALVAIGVDCVTLANNHALDFGPVALADTLALLHEAGIATVGAGPDAEAARAPARLETAAGALVVVGVTDHPAAFAAGPNRWGVAYAPLQHGVPAWLTEHVAHLGEGGDPVLVTPHWGPNMVAAPVPHVRRAAATLRAAGATLVAGHSAHVFHSVHDGVLYDLGDFIDDYAVDPVLRNDLGLVFFVRIADGQAERIEAIPLALELCYTRLADPGEAAWIANRFERACGALGTTVSRRDGRLVIEPLPA